MPIAESKIIYLQKLKKNERIDALPKMWQRIYLRTRQSLGL